MCRVRAALFPPRRKLLASLYETFGVFNSFPDLGDSRHGRTAEITITVLSDGVPQDRSIDREFAPIAQLARVVAVALDNAAHVFSLRQGIIHAPPATSLPSAKFARIQAAPYRALEGHLNEESTIIASIVDEPCSTQTTDHKRRNDK